MADRALRFDLLGRDKTLGRTLGQAEGKFKRFGKTAVKMGTVIGGAFAGLAIGGFLKDAISEAREAQKVGRQTAAVLKATGGIAKVSARDVDRLATALSNKAGVDDELIASGANLLLTFKNVRNEAGKGNRIFDQASSAILDMTAAMNDGEVSASGLKASTIQVGKALQDPIKGISALTRVGVTFTQKQKDQIKTLVESGRTMDAQKIILGELKSEFGGAAAAAADPWQRFSVLMGNIKERIGTALLPALTSVFDFLTTTLIPGIERYIGRLRGFVAKVGEAIGPAISTLTGDIQAKFDQFKPKLTSFKTNLVKGVRKLAQPVLDALGTALKTGDYGPLGKAVGDALAKILQATGDLASKVEDWISEQFGKINWLDLGKNAGVAAGAFALSFVPAFLEGIIDTAIAHPMDAVKFVAAILPVGKVAGLLLKAFKFLGKIPLIGPLLKALDQATGPVNNAIGRLVGAMARFFGRALQRAFPEISGRFGRWLTSLIIGIAGRYNQMKRAAVRFVAGLLDGIEGQAALVFRNIAQLIGWVTKPFIRAGTWLIRRGGQVVTGLIRGVEAVGRGLGRVALRVINWLTIPFRPAAGWLVTRGRQAIGGLVRGVDALRGAVSRAASAVIRAVTSPFRNAIGWLVGAGGDLVRGLRRGIDAGIQHVGGVLGRLKDAIVGGIKRLFGIHSPSTVMAGLGSNMVAGLVKGLVTNAGSLRKIIGSMGVSVRSQFASMFAELFGGGGGSARGLVGYAATAFQFFRDMFPGMTIGGWRAQGSVPGSDHPKGKALDLMTTSNAVAQRIISMFMDLPGKKYWIWNRQIATASGGWQPRAYSGPSPHTDHVHLSFFKRGAWKLLSDQLGFLHKGEMVVPAAPAEQIRRSVGAGRPEPLAPPGRLTKADADLIAAAFLRALERHPVVATVTDVDAAVRRRQGRLGQARVGLG